MKKIFTIIMLLAFGFALNAQSFVDLVEEVNKSVVTIYVMEKKNPGQGDPYKKVSMEGLGSGSIVGEFGMYVLTASHVVDNATKIVVELYDGRKVGAKIFRTSKIADVALLKLDRPVAGIKPAIIGNSDSVRIGEDVFVIGAPLGLTHSVSKGIISGKHLEDNMSANFMRMEFLQTDASINQGNSGGPMFNMKGEVIGIVSSILSFSGGFEGLGFAATSNIAKTLLTQRGTAWFGIDALPMNQELCMIFNVPQKGALLVQGVTEGSPGHFMGMKGGYIKMSIADTEFLGGGDIILTFDKIVLDDISKIEDLRNYINTLEKYHEYRIKVLRNGEVVNLRWKMDQ